MRASSWITFKLRKILFAVGIVLVFAALAKPAYADSCVSGNLSSVIGTTCDIGTLTFTFTGIAATNTSFLFTDSTLTGGTRTDYAPLTASDFSFTALSNGFELVGPSESITTPNLGNAVMNFGVFYSVTDNNGMITGVDVSGSSFSATGANFSNVQNNLDLGCSGCSDSMSAVNLLSDNLGTNSFLHQSTATGPFASGFGDAWAFQIYAQFGNSAALVNDDSTFTFNTTAPTATPEPGSALLLGIGLVALTGIGWGRRRLA